MSVKGRDVFVVLDFAMPDSRKMSPEAVLIANALITDTYISFAQQAGHAAKLHGAAKVHLIMPNFAYARQDKAHGECGPISAAITAQNLEPYYDSVTSVHLHSPAIQGMFRAIPLHVVAQREIYAPTYVCRDPDTFEPIAASELTVAGVNKLFSQLCIVSPDAGGAANAREFAKYCKLFACTILGIPEDALVDIPMAQIDKRRSGPNEAEVMNVLGEKFVKGRKADIIDDMGDTFTTADKAASALMAVGATSVAFWGTHGYFSGTALDRIKGSKISTVNISNSMALQPSVTESGRARVVDISALLAQVVIDLTTKPEINLHVRERHLQDDGERRRILGRHVFAMMPQQTAA